MFFCEIGQSYLILSIYIKAFALRVADIAYVCNSETSRATTILPLSSVENARK